MNFENNSKLCVCVLEWAVIRTSYSLIQTTRGSGVQGGDWLQEQGWAWVNTGAHTHTHTHTHARTHTHTHTHTHTYSHKHPLHPPKHDIYVRFYPWGLKLKFQICAREGIRLQNMSRPSSLKVTPWHLWCLSKHPYKLERRAFHNTHTHTLCY